MLAIFNKGVVNPPKELNSQSNSNTTNPKHPQDALNDFLSSQQPSSNAANFSFSFGDKASLAFSPPQSQFPTPRLFGGVDDIYCIFLGCLNNLCALNKQYGLTKNANESMFVVEAYRTLRDRGPIPAHQVLKDLEGSFGFVVYDAKLSTVFVSLGGDGRVKLFWGVGSDGSVVIADNLEVIKGSCGKSFAPFPIGCMYHSEGGLMSYEHPTLKMKAMPRVDSEGAMCGANFKVDVYTKAKSMPRVGSEANWATWGQEA